MIEITDAIRQRIEEVIEFANQHVVTVDDFLDQRNGKAHPLLLHAGNKLLIDNLYAVTYTIDESLVKAGGIERIPHVSVFMVNHETPAMNVLRLIADAFGFPDIDGCYVLKVIQHGYTGVDVWEHKPS